MKLVACVSLTVFMSAAGLVFPRCSDASGLPVSETSSKDAADQVKEISTDQLRALINSRRPFLLIDVREDDEWQAGHAKSAIHIPRLMLSARIASVAPQKNTQIVLYCLAGRRSAAGAEVLQQNGYTKVFSLAGGFRSYQQAGLPVEQ